MRLPRVRRIAVNVVAGGVWATGVLWLATHYFMREPGPFGPQINPLEPWWLKAHALFAFAAVWTMGLLWGVHIVNGWNAGLRRGSGSSLVLAAAFLIATGYLLYYLGDETLRVVDGFAHWVLGLAAVAVFAWHRWRRRGRDAS